MSILSDALRRARGDGSKWARTLGASPMAARAERSASWLPWLLCALLVALVVGLAVYIGLIHERAGQGAAMRPAPAAGVESQSPPAREPSASRAARHVSSAVPQEPGRARLSTAPPTPQRRDPAEPAKVAADTPAAAPGQGAQSAAGTGAQMRAPQTQGASEHGSRTATPQPVTLAMLPADVRRDFPDLQIVAHVWNADPELRFIVAAGRQLRVGDEIAGGVRLVEITRRGEVVAFRGYRIHLR
ncbi:MAG: general secretion pathway protein GspB [Gammaproteobacteria bacterium]|nr:general secretion pathway protein GspB [Gammaproteobacteria bacterium]